MFKTILQGGYMMIPLMFLSVLTIAVVIDRAMAFMKNRSVDVQSLRAEVMRLVKDGNIQDAILLCASTPGPVSAVILAGLQSLQNLQNAGESTNAIRVVMAKSMDDYALHAISAVQKRLSILDTVGNSAPLFGMSGTVLGMISAFANMAQSSGLDASVVAGGISEALITTAGGLLIALGEVIPLKIFSSFAEEIELEIEDASTELVEFAVLSSQE
ncbi:MAG: MotA/TolQ/ExbB proton channel family protein [Lentisphaeria bacterium]|nr:MotA/TolQ/ExbB proton channel family protein [Lentisphaeria bacterium]